MAACATSRDALSSIFQRLLADERENLTKFIHDSHIGLSGQFESYLDEIFREGPTNLLAPDNGYSFAGALLDQSFVNCERVKEPAGDASLPDAVCHAPPLSPRGSNPASPPMLPAPLPSVPSDRQAWDGSCRTYEAADQQWEETVTGDQDDYPERGVSEAADSTRSGFEMMEKLSSAKRTAKSGSSIRHSNSELTGPLTKRLVNSPIVEAVFTGLIFINALCMGLEQQYNGFGVGYELQANGYTQPKEEIWPQGELFFVVAEYFFGVVFTLEVVMKIAVLRAEFVKSMWNLYDSFIIVCWLIQSLSMFNTAVDPLILRLARMGRLLRLLRFAKAFQVFDVLHLLVHSMLACMSALLWSAIFLALVMMTNALVLIYLLQEELHNEEIALDQRLLLHMYFGTFSNAMFSMYELTMGNWVPISRAVISNVSEWYMIFFVIYRTLVGFAVLKVITAIFNAETFRVAQSDDNIMIMHRERQIKTHTSRMEKLLIEGDESQDGYLNLEEFQELLGDPRVQKWLAAQEIEVKDVALAFKMIDEGADGRVSAEELVRGFSRLKGAARSMDMVTLIEAIKRVDATMSRLDQAMNSHAAEAEASRNKIRFVIQQNASGAPLSSKKGL
eukprot:TRINITY_DN91135_c0_g1_i1.p1 TRINITY_DN91135_c0_g1~~TRINITY_DN91135_c0_g1_i1.p1  ORF type:complete len:617 (+),score=93.85 TRINITY_DN91135_c0_g1_i1:187-2037(+)